MARLIIVVDEDGDGNIAGASIDYLTNDGFSVSTRYAETPDWIADLMRVGIDGLAEAVAPEKEIPELKLIRGGKETPEGPSST